MQSQLFTRPHTGLFRRSARAFPPSLGRRLAMLSYDRRAAAVWALRLQGRRWLGPHPDLHIRPAPKPRGSTRRARARARAMLRSWVAEHAREGVPAVAGWMVSANFPGADRALQWLRDAMELPLETDTWRTSQSCLIAASIAHGDASHQEACSAAAVAVLEAAEAEDAASERWRKACFQISEEQDLAMLEVDEICRNKCLEDWEDRLVVMGQAAVDKYSSLDDVPQSIRMHIKVSGSRGCGGSGASWGPRVSRRPRFRLLSFHENVAPYEPAHVGVSSMRFVEDLTSSIAACRLISRAKPINRIAI